MSNAKHPGYERGYSDYKRDKPCLVTKTRKGLRFNVEDDMGMPHEEREAWGAAYVEGYVQAIKDDDPDVPMASKERLRR
jgi:hypothetical protein